MAREAADRSCERLGAGRRCGWVPASQQGKRSRAHGGLPVDGPRVGLAALGSPWASEAGLTGKSKAGGGQAGARVGGRGGPPPPTAAEQKRARRTGPRAAGAMRSVSLNFREARAGSRADRGPLGCWAGLCVGGGHLSSCPRGQTGAPVFQPGLKRPRTPSRSSTEHKSGARRMETV